MTIYVYTYIYAIMILPP